MPSKSPASRSRVVSVRSSALGVGSPEGWLCYVTLRVMWSLLGKREKQVEMRESWASVTLPHVT